MDTTTEELLFNLSCVDDTQRLYVDDWIYYINSNDLSEEGGDNAIWKIKKDGTGNQRVQKSSTKVMALIGVDVHWIYFMGKKLDDPMKSILHDVLRGITCIEDAENMKMTVRGGLERLMNKKDLEKMDRQILELEKELW